MILLISCLLLLTKIKKKCLRLKQTPQITTPLYLLHATHIQKSLSQTLLHTDYIGMPAALSIPVHQTISSLWTSACLALPPAWLHPNKFCHFDVQWVVVHVKHDREYNFFHVAKQPWHVFTPIRSLFSYRGSSLGVGKNMA